MTTAPAPAQKTNLATIVTPGANPLVPEPEILQPGDKEKHAASLNDKELIAHVRTTLHNLRDDLPYLREARNRFAQPGRRVPVEGQPTWKEWVEANLHVKIRTVQRWLEETKPKKDKKTRQVKPLKDWPDAMRRADDLVTAVKRLQAKTPVKGADMLIPALRELAAIAGRQLVEPTHTPEPKLEPTVGKVEAPKTAKPGSRKKIERDKDTNPKVNDPQKAEEDKLKKAADKLKKAEIAKETNTIAAKHGWSVDERGQSVYRGADEP